MVITQELLSELKNDNDFLGLPFEEKVKFFEQEDEEFNILPSQEKRNFLNSIDVTTPAGPTELAETVSMISRPVLEGGLSVAGGVAGAPLAPTTLGTSVIAGGALGFGIGNEIADNIDRFLGIQEPLTNLAEVTQETASDLKRGLEFEAIGRGIGVPVGKAIQFGLGPFRSRVTDATRVLIQKAKSLGVDLSPADITKSKSLALIEGVFDKIPFATSFVRKFRLNQVQALLKERERLIQAGGADEAIEAIGFKIQNQIQSLLNKNTALAQTQKAQLANRLLKKLGSSETLQGLGDSAQQAVKKFTDDFSRKSQALFNKVGDFIDPTVTHSPSKTIAKAEELLKKELTAKPELQDQGLIRLLRGFIPKTNRVRTGIIGADGKEVIRTIREPLRFNFDQYRANRSILGERIAEADPGFKTQIPGIKGLGDRTSGAMKTLRRALSEDFDEFAKGTNESARQALDIANSFYREGKAIINSKPVLAVLKSNPDMVLETVFRSDSATDLQLLKKAIGGANFAKLKNRFTGRLLGISDNILGAEKPLTGDAIRRNINKFEPDTLAEIYSRDELQELITFAKQIDDLDLRMVSSELFKRTLKTTPQSVVDFIVKPNNTANIKLVRSQIGKEGVENLRKGFLTKIFKLQPDNSFSPIRFANELSKFGDDTLKELFDEKTFRDLKRLGEVGRAAGVSERISANPSGTGQAMITFMGGSAVLTNPAKGGLFFLSASALSDLYNNPVTRKLLSEGFTIPFNAPEASVVASKIIQAVIGRRDRSF